MQAQAQMQAQIKQSATQPAPVQYQAPAPLTASPRPLGATPPANAPDTDSPERRAARRRPSGPARDRVAANDDGPSIGGLIYALNQKPSTKPFKIAAIGSGIWTALCLGFAGVLLAPDFSAGTSAITTLVSSLGRPGILTAAATLFGPIALLWFLGLLAWRADELKLRATAMTEVAVRLAEPDRMAEQSVASLGQAVRRQVSFMNDAVSRALGRAGELEALVHNEVASLERSYQENERRIRGLIQELAGERGALVNTGDRVAETMRGISSEVPALIEKLSTQQLKLAKIIEGAGQNLTALESALATQTGNLETQIGTRTEHLQKVLETYTASLGNTLGARSTEMQTLFDGYMESIDSTIGNRTETLQVVFEEYARALDTTLANRAQSLDAQLVERTKALDDAFSDRLVLFDESMRRSTVAIDNTVTNKAEALSRSIELHTKSIGDTLGRQAVEFDESLMHGINAVRRSSESITKQSIKAIEGLAGQSDLLKNVSENLLTQINSVTNRFENQGQSIMRAANALETANYKIDSTLQKRQVELGSTLERMTEKADDLGKFMQGYQTSLEGSISQAEGRARQLTDDFTRTAEQRQRQTLDEMERLKLAAHVEAERTTEEMRNRVNLVSQEVAQKLGSLTNQFAESSAEMRARTAEAAAALADEQARLRAQTEQMPVVARDSAEQMRHALKDQFRAIDQLSSLANREHQRRDVTPPSAEPFAIPAPPVGALLAGMPQVGVPQIGSQIGAPQISSTPSQPRMSSLSSTLAQELRRPAGASSAAGTSNAPVPAAVASAAATAWKLGDLLARASHDQDDHGVAWALGLFSSNSAQQARLSGIDPAFTPALLALNTSAMYTGQAIGAASGGAILSAGGYAQLSWTALAFVLVALTLSLVLGRHMRQQSRRQEPPTPHGGSHD